MDRACAACGSSLEGANPRRKYCDDRCKMRFHSGARADEGQRKESPDQEGIKSTEAATMLALGEASKLGTPGGQAALVLARRIDASYRDTGAGLASMVKRLQETVDQLVSEAPDDEDPVDELTRRREEKQRDAASG